MNTSARVPPPGRASFARQELAERRSAGRVRAPAPYVSRGGFPIRESSTIFPLECLAESVLPSNNPFVTFYRRNLPHLQRDYKPHFVTFVTKNRRVLADWARQIVFDCCRHDHEKKYNLRVVVVMPDHVHMILTPLTDERGRRIFPLRRS